MEDDLIVHNKDFQKYPKIIVVDDKGNVMYEYTLTKTMVSEG